MPDDLQPLAEAADCGDLVAQTLLGIKFAKGEGVAQNWEAASKWWLKAAQAGDARAQSLLGFMF